MAKILISDDSGCTAHYFIRLGAARALVASGHEVVIWDIRKKSAFDAFDDFKPDFFIGQTYNVDEGLVKILKERPIPLSLRGSDWGPKQKEIDRNLYPILVANDREKRLCSELLPLNPIIDCHYPEEYLEETMGFWKKNGFKTVSLLTGADVFEYTNGKKIEEFRSDVCFVGGRWGYKSKTLDKYITPLCQDTELAPVYKYMVGVDVPDIPKLNVKIFGNQPWNVSQYCGYIPDHLVKDVLASATICPNIHEPHSQDFGYDIVERVWKLGSNKCFCVSDSVAGLKNVFKNNEIIFAENPKEFFDIIGHYIRYPEDRQEFIDRYYNSVINNHTYFHRMAQWFDYLEMPSESENILKSFEKVKQELSL